MGGPVPVAEIARQAIGRGNADGGHRRRVLWCDQRDLQAASLPKCDSDARRPIVRRAAIVWSQVIANVDMNSGVVARPEMQSRAKVECRKCALAVADAEL